MFDPPPGDTDLAADVEDLPADTRGYRDLAIEGIDITVKARRPQPRSAHAIAAAANSKASVEMKIDHVTLFVRHHIRDEDYEEILRGTLTGEYPSDTMTRVARELAIWGTARPTMPWSP